MTTGMNLCALCQEHDLKQSCMWQVMHGKRVHHKGWELMSSFRVKR